MKTSKISITEKKLNKGKTLEKGIIPIDSLVIAP